MAIKHHSNETFLDSNKLMFGTGEDLQMLHDGSNSYIHHNGTGSLYMKADTGDINIINYTNDKDIIFQCDDGSGGTETYFFLDGSNGLTTFPDNKKLGFGNASDLRIQERQTLSLKTQSQNQAFRTFYPKHSLE